MTKLTDNQKKILKVLKNNDNLSEISRILSLDRSYVSRTVKSLSKKQLIDIVEIRSNFKEYNITEKGLALLSDSHTKNNNMKLRLHRIEIKITIPNNWKPRWEQYLNKYFTITDYKTIKLNNNEQRQFIIDTLRVKTTSSSILIYPQDIIAENVSQAERQLTETIHRIVPKVQNALKFPIYKESWNNIEISTQEWALMNDPLAKKVINDNQKLEIRINKERRVLIDFSKKVPELETTHRRYAPEDMKKIENMYQDLITEKFNPRELNKQMLHQTNYMEEFAKNVDLYNQNVLSHMKVVNEMRETMKEMRDMFKNEFKEMIKKLTD